MAATALWLLAWFVVLARWMNRRIEADRAALLLATISAGSLALYSLLRSEINAVIVLALIVWGLVGYAFSRYALRVFADDRPRSDGGTPEAGVPDLDPNHRR